MGGPRARAGVRARGTRERRGTTRCLNGCPRGVIFTPATHPGMCWRDPSALAAAAAAFCRRSSCIFCTSNTSLQIKPQGVPSWPYARRAIRRPHRARAHARTSTGLPSSTLLLCSFGLVVMHKNCSWTQPTRPLHTPSSSTTTTTTTTTPASSSSTSLPLTALLFFRPCPGTAPRRATPMSGLRWASSSRAGYQPSGGGVRSRSAWPGGT